MSFPLSLQDESNLNEEDSTLIEQVNNDETLEETEDLSTIKVVQNVDNSQDNKSGENTAELTIKPTDQNEVEKSMPSTSAVPDEEVDSQRPSNSRSTAKEASSAKKALNTEKQPRKRRSERINTQRKNVAEEVDSAKPRSSKRPKKRMVALFLESEYPRKK